MDDQMEIILNKLSKLENEAARAHEHRTLQQHNIERFWAKDWRDLTESIDKIYREQVSIEGRVRNLEIMLAPIPERVAKLEGKSETMERRLQNMSIAVIVVGVAALGNIGTAISKLI